ncbi:MAG: DNA-directed RNA polymerase subunit alpha, partial [Planctomycetales bacterium]
MRIRWRGLQLPSQVVCDPVSLTTTYGRFSVEPFERGFGATVGNSLRRILLSSLEGSAVTEIRIEGVQHEFSTLPGVVEDMTDVVLNVKALVVKNYSDEQRVVIVEKNTRGVVTGSDVQTDEAVEVINPDHVLATLTEDVPFEMAMVVESGRGYVPATERMPKEREIGVIPIDSLFTPVRRVEWEVEETRVGKKTNYDRLNLEICTDGSIGPEFALVEAAKIFRKHLNPFLQYNELGSFIHAEAPQAIPHPEHDAVLEAKLNMSIAELKLSVRATNCLESESI